ncbi:hypothetical protein V8C86DRAFT_2782625 [Haematococcus lacustris]
MLTCLLSWTLCNMSYRLAKRVWDICCSSTLGAGTAPTTVAVPIADLVAPTTGAVPTPAPAVAAAKWYDVARAARCCRSSSCGSDMCVKYCTISLAWLMCSLKACSCMILVKYRLIMWAWQPMHNTRGSLSSSSLHSLRMGVGVSVTTAHTLPAYKA